MLRVLADGDLGLNIILFLPADFNYGFAFTERWRVGGQDQAEQGGRVNGGLSARERRRRNGEMI